jgi:hypothetical protein
VTYRVVYDMYEDELPDAAAVEDFFDERSKEIAPHGARANAYWFARVGVDDELRLDLDFDAGRAALRWLPDGTYAVELDLAESIVVLESSDYDVVTIPARRFCPCPLLYVPRRRYQFHVRPINRVAIATCTRTV